MYRDTVSTRSPGSPIFPFLSVLICTIGVLALILVAGSVKSLFKIPPEQIKQAKVKLAELGPQVEDAEQQLAKYPEQIEAFADIPGKLAKVHGETSDLDAKQALMAKSNETAVRKIEQKTGDLKDLAAKEQETLAVPEKVNIIAESLDVRVARDDARKKRNSLKVSTNAGAKRATALRAERDKATGHLADLRNKLGPPQVRFTVYGAGADKPPAYVEIAPDAMKVLTDGLSVAAGTSVPKAEATGKDGVLARLAAEQAARATKHYVVFLVRPRAADFFRAAAAAFREKHVDFGHEPVESDWEIRFDEETRPSAFEGTPSPG